MSESKEFVKALFLDWSNYYRCSGSPTKTKDINKIWLKWQCTIMPEMKKEARNTGELKLAISVISDKSLLAFR